ncbi:hypothetical protein Tco_1312141 [Tanacetum coccineum]
MEDNLFTYELRVVEDFYFPCVEQQCDNLKNYALDVYEPRVCYYEIKQIYTKAVILINKRLARLIDITVEQWLDLKFGDDRKVDKEITKEVISTWLIMSYKKQFIEYMEIKKCLEIYGLYADVECDSSNVITDEELSDLEEEKVSEEKEIAEIFRIETDIFDFKTPLYLPGFKTYEDYKDAWIYEWNKDVPWVKENPWLENGTWEKPNNDIDHDHAGMTNEDDAIQADQEWFDNYEPMKNNDDDIMDLDDYLIRKDVSYYVDEEEERFKERKRKLLGIPYEKPPTFKSEKFEVIKYSLDLRKSMLLSKNMSMIFGYEPKKTCLASTKKFFARRTKDGP